MAGRRSGRVKDSLGGLEAAKTVCSQPAHGRRIRVCVTRPQSPGPVMQGAEALCRMLRPAAHADRESFWGVHLDAQLRVLGVEEVSKGTLTEVAVHPRELFKSALLSNAYAIAIAHNHPSGSAAPSEEDIALTRRIVRAGHLLGVPILDHVILAGTACVSLRERRPGLFEP